MKHRINIVHSDEWDGVYVNDELIYQDYSIDPMELILRIKLKIPGSAKLNDLSVDEWYAEPEWISKVMLFPKNFEDVKLRF